MKNKIYIDDWKAFKPYKGHSATDLFYLKVANEVCDELIFYFGTIFSDEIDPQLFSCFITSYFEDVISKTHIFNTFRNKHQELYDKKLPFFDCSDEYFDDEINPEDIAFLTWYYINTVSTEKVIHPNKELFLKLAEDIIEVFDRHYEFAPENNSLKDFYVLQKSEDLVDQYFFIRNLMESLFLNSYLFLPDLSQRLSKTLDEIKNLKDKEFIPKFAYAATTEFLLNKKTRLLHLRANELTADFLGKNHELYQDVREISIMIQGDFKVEGFTEKYILLSHLASVQKISLLKESYSEHEALQKGDGIFLGLVRFKNEWIQVGISYVFEISDKHIIDAKNDFSKSIIFNAIFKDEKLITESLKSQKEAFLRVTGGKEYIFLKKEEINQFIEQFYQSSNKPEKAKKFISKLQHDDEDVYTLYFNPNTGVEILEDIQGAFFDNDNVFLNEDNVHSDFPFLFLTDNASPEIVKFCIENYKSKIPFFNLKDREIYFNNLDFSLRFFKPENYKTEPSLKFV